MKNITQGLKVWSLIHGEGFVKSYDGEIILCVFGYQEVKFTHNGRLPEFRNNNQVLFFSQPKIEALAVPPYKPRFKHMEQVIVSYNQDGSNGKCIQVEFENEFCVTSRSGKDYPKDEYYFFKLGQEIVMT